MRHDYGDTHRGEGYEYVNFFNSLQCMGHEIELFDYMEQLQLHGQPKMNGLLLSKAETYRPDLALVSLYTDQLYPESVVSLRQWTKTLCFFHDDTWRREFVTTWAPRFDWFTSPDWACYEKYSVLGLDHVIHFPFGANENLYRPQDLPKKYDISFVGQWHPHRAWLIKRLRQAGMKVLARGFGWPDGPVSLTEMTKIFCQSYINLNLSNCSNWDARYLTSSWKAIKDTLRSKKIFEQVKGRHFEIPACGGFQLSYYVDGLERYYKAGSEILFFSNPDDLIDKCRYYLSNKHLCDAIGLAAYQRTMTEHTYSARFEQAFKTMGLEN